MGNFRTHDNDAMGSQNQFHRQQVILLLGGALVTALGAIQVTAAALTHNSTWFGLAEAVLAAILGGVAQHAQNVKAQQSYFSSRLKAEALRDEYFLFLARLRPYHEDQTRQRRLRDRVTEIKNSNKPQPTTLPGKSKTVTYRQRASDPQEQDQQLWNLYYHGRYENQLDFYTSRRNEFQKAQAQATFLTIALMTSASVVSLFGSYSLLGASIIWGVLAVVFPVLATALSTYESVYAFERQAKLYEDAIGALESVGMRPTLEGASVTAFQKYVNLIESILKAEQGQWGQLVSEIRGATAPGAAADPGGGG